MRARIARFVIVVTVLLLAFTWFVDATWLRFSGASGLAWRFGPMLAVLSFIPVTILGRLFRHPLLKVLTVLTGMAIGLLSFALIAAIGCWLALGAAALGGFPLAARPLADVLFGGAALAVAGGAANAARLRVTRVTAVLPHLPPAWAGLTAALISDVHLGNVRGKSFVRRIVARLNVLQPAAVFISGDMFDGAAIDLDAAAAPWSQFKAPAGVYFVAGNHDEFTGRSAVCAVLRRVGIRVLDNEKVTERGLQIVGVHDSEGGDPRQLRGILERVGLDPGQASILLNHRPGHLAIAEAAGISLQLSGHTHFGQFWPWNWVVSRIYGRFGYGLNRRGKLLVLTSSGAGTWGPPLRLGTRSEIVLIRFESS